MYIGALLQIKYMILVMHWIMESIVDSVCCTRLLDLAHPQTLALLFVCQYGYLASYHVIFQKETQG